VFTARNQSPDDVDDARPIAERFVETCRLDGGRFRFYRALAKDVPWVVVRDLEIPGDERIACMECEYDERVTGLPPSSKRTIRFAIRCSTMEAPFGVLFPADNSDAYKVTSGSQIVLTHRPGDRVWMATVHDHARAAHPFDLPGDAPMPVFDADCIRGALDRSSKRGAFGGELLTPFDESLAIIRDDIGWRHIEL
jgi:hypothetical protein